MDSTIKPNHRLNPVSRGIWNPEEGKDAHLLDGAAYDMSSQSARSGDNDQLNR